VLELWELWEIDISIEAIELWIIELVIKDIEKGGVIRSIDGIV
jgi:hypothetical protein